MSLEKAIFDWLSSPINVQGTPYIAIPEDFSITEQNEFVSLVREHRFVSKSEQLNKLREIISKRKNENLTKGVVDGPKR